MKPKQSDLPVIVGWWKTGSNAPFHGIVEGPQEQGRFLTLCGKRIKLFRSDRAIRRSRSDHCIRCIGVSHRVRLNDGSIAAGTQS